MMQGGTPHDLGNLHILVYTFWLFNIAMENDPFIDGLPITRWYCNQRSTDLRDIHGYPTDYCIKK
jgi:hypothetical protein